MTRLIVVLVVVVHIIMVLILIGVCSSPTPAAPPVPSPEVCAKLGLQWLDDMQHVPDQVLAARADTMIACGLQELDPAKHGGKISEEQITLFRLYGRAWLILLDRLKLQQTPASAPQTFVYASVRLPAAATG